MNPSIKNPISAPEQKHFWMTPKAILLLSKTGVFSKTKDLYVRNVFLWQRLHFWVACDVITQTPIFDLLFFLDFDIVINANSSIKKNLYFFSYKELGTFL